MADTWIDAQGGVDRREQIAFRDGVVANIDAVARSTVDDTRGLSNVSPASMITSAFNFRASLGLWGLSIMTMPSEVVTNP